MGDRLRSLLAIGALVGAALITIAQSQNPLRPVTGDFIARYAGGAVAAAGGTPYDNELLAPRERVLADDPGIVVIPMYDPPPVVAAFRIGSVLPLRAASLALEGASLLAGVVIAGLVTRGEGRRVWLLAAVGLLVTSATRAALANGQTDLVALAMVLLLARWQPVLAIAKPQTTGPTALALFLTPDGRSAGRRVAVAAVGAGALLLATEALGGGASWGAWFRHLGTRPETPADLSAILVLASVVGVGLLARGLLRSRANLGGLDAVGLAGLATSFVAVMGGWNPWWHLAQVVGLAALLLAIRRGEVHPSRHQVALLLLAVAAMTGDAYSAYSLGRTFQMWVPVAGLACFLVALVLWREVSAKAAGAIVVLNAGITAVHLGQGDRAIVSVLVSVILVHLTLELRPVGQRWVTPATG